MYSFLKLRPKVVRNPNRPKKGSAIKVEPIRKAEAIARIKKNLRRNPRNLLLFVMGINLAFRANELLSIKVGQVRDLKAGEDLEIKLSKTKTYRRVTVNQAVVDALQFYLKARKLKDDDWLFRSLRTERPLTVSTVSRYVKRWCQIAGLRGNYASHSLRKTWGYMQRTIQNAPVPLLMMAYGHSTQMQTIKYLCIQTEEIAAIYNNMVL